MAQHQITVERPWANIPTKQLVNTETGQTEVFLPNPGSPFGDTKVAQAGANNQWEITDKNELLKRYNNKNSTNITEQELNKKFFTDGTKQFNNDRAAVINKNSPENTKTFLATKANPVPGTIDPKTGIKAGQTAPTTAVGEIDSSIPGTGESISGTFDKENQFGNLKYPANLANDKQDVIKFSMLKYLPSGVGATQPGGESARGGLKSGIPKGREIIGTTVLPIPNAISDSNLVSWGEDNMDAVKAALSAAAFSAITGGFSKGMENAGASLQVFAGESATGSFAAGTFAAAAAGGEGSKLLSRATGQVINPNLELLFNAPQLRPFSFTFKLAARSKEEGQTILKIINFFKRGMSPIRTDSNLFLKSPNTFAIEYLHMGATNPNIGRIKECALQSVTTSYTPEGQYATFSDGVMVSYQITMQFSELEPIFNDDYNELTGIGF
jgi:hypothetical protein